jgi:RND family efflux transporter MFP subunit
MATPLDGILVEVAVEEGQRIEAGTLMGRMDDAMQVATVEAAALRAASVAEIEIRELELAEAEVALERIQQVYSKAAAAEWEVRQARIERDQAGARLKAAREQQALAQVELKLEQTRLDRHRIKAPFAGQVVRVVVEAGAMLTQGSPMLLLANVQPLEAELHLPVSAIGQLQIGRTYPLTAGEPVNATVQGRLKTVDPVFDTASATVRCVFMVDNPGGAMPAGFTVEMLRP